jgi:phosphonatase-like hydrolase
MQGIRLAVFDLSGTTVSDDNAVAKCLHRAATEHGLDVGIEEIEKSIGTNKIHLYEYLIARQQGADIDIRDLETHRFEEHSARAMEMFRKYSEYMVEHYRTQTLQIPGAEEVFDWCHRHGILVATDTGFHRDVSLALMDGLKWLQRGLVDLHIDVEDTGGIGRPAPFMIHQAMYRLGVQSVHQVAKIGDTPADLLSGYHAGCRVNVGVLSGANSRETLEKYPHTHILNSVWDLPGLIHSLSHRNDNLS